MKRVMAFALLGAVAMAAVGLAQYPLMSIRQIQEVPVGRDSSFYAGDTVRVSGVVVAGTGLYYAGAGVTFYMQNTGGGPWSGIMAYNPSATGFPTLIPGDSISCTARISEYGWNGPPFCTMTELDILPGTFQFHSFGNPEPPALVTTAAMLDSTNNSDSLGEQFEGVYCRVNEVTVDSVIVYSNTSTWICHDTTGHQFMVREASDSISFLPTVGMTFAYVQGVIYHRFGNYNLQPRYMRDMQLPTGAPIISNVYHSPANPINAGPTDADSVAIYANIVDNDSVTNAWLRYRFNLGSWQTVVMNRGSNNYWSFRFPPLPANYRVDYYIKAQDISGDTSRSPDQAPISFYQFRVQQPREMTIAQSKIDSDNNFEPDMMDSAVTLTGIATSYNFSTTRTDFYMQDATAGISVVFFGTPMVNISIGDSVRATGTIDQYYGKTQLVANRASRIQILANNRPFDTLWVTCSQLGENVGEANEGRLAMVDPANIVDDPDPWPLLGVSATMTITDVTGSAALRIDRSTNIPGQNRPVGPQKIVGVIGQYDLDRPYSGGYQLMPRMYADFTNSTDIDDHALLPDATTLHQNYPNPFNPSTTISYHLARPSDVSIKIYDIMGRVVFDFHRDDAPAGAHTFVWDGNDNDGRPLASGIYFYKMSAQGFVETKRMVLLK